MTQALALTRLLQLSSVSLPVGGYAFSQGMEMAIEKGWITSVSDVEDWLVLQLSENIARLDLPVLKRAMLAAEQNDAEQLVYLNDLSLASRETKELRLTESAMGEALHRLLNSLEFELPDTYKEQVNDDFSFVVLFGFAAAKWKIPFDMCANGFTWSWLENQVAAATKLVPLGQTQAQVLLTKLQSQVECTINRSECVEYDEIGGGLPALAIASAWHERQYSRLFRS